MDITKQRRLGYLCALIAAAGFACSIVLARVSYDHGSNAQTVMLIRFILLLGVLFVWNQMRGQSLRLDTRKTIYCLLAGIAYFIGIGSYLSSIGYLPVSLAVLIFYTNPILIILLNSVLLRRMPGKLLMLAVLVAFTGLALALDVKTEGLQAIGLVFACFAALGVAINMISSGLIMKTVPTTVFSFYMSITTILLSALAVFYSGGLALPATLTGYAYFAAMLLSFLVGYLATYNAVRLLGAVPTAIMMNLEPVWTILVAMLLLGELFTGQQVLGGAVVLLGILLAQIAPTKIDKQADTPAS